MSAIHFCQNNKAVSVIPSMHRWNCDVLKWIPSNELVRSLRIEFNTSLPKPTKTEESWRRSLQIMPT